MTHNIDIMYKCAILVRIHVLPILMLWHCHWLRRLALVAIPRRGAGAKPPAHNKRSLCKCAILVRIHVLPILMLWGKSERNHNDGLRCA